MTIENFIAEDASRRMLLAVICRWASHCRHLILENI